MIIDVHEAFINAITNISEFEHVETGYIPPPSRVTKFPSVAIDFHRLQKKRVNTGVCQFNIKEDVDLYVYTRASKKNIKEDLIPPLVEIIDRQINTDSALNDLVIDTYVSEVVSDGYLTYPIVVARVTVSIEYRLTKTY